MGMESRMSYLSIQHFLTHPTYQKLPCSVLAYSGLSINYLYRVLA